MLFLDRYISLNISKIKPSAFDMWGRQRDRNEVLATAVAVAIDFINLVLITFYILGGAFSKIERSQRREISRVATW